MDTFTWTKSSETMAVATWQHDDVALSVTVAASIPEGEHHADFFIAGIVGVIGSTEIIESARCWSMVGTRPDGSPSRNAAFFSCGDLLDGPSLGALKNIVHVVTDRNLR